jgi:hypothetical protein
MSAHPAPRATRSIRAETAGSSGLALGPNQRGKAGGEVKASIPVMAMARQRTRGRVRHRSVSLRAPKGVERPDPSAGSGSTHTWMPAGWSVSSTRCPDMPIQAVSKASRGWNSYRPRQARSPCRDWPKNSAVAVVPWSSVIMSSRAPTGRPNG